MGFTASDLAELVDKTADEHWQQQDDWLIEAHKLGDAHPVIVFAAWASDRFNKAPIRAPAAIGQGAITEVLSLGNDMSFDSVGEFGKGVALNLLRVLTVAQPVAGGLKSQFRHRGLLALTELKNITGSKAPCQYSAFNNVVTFLKGKPAQHFADVRDIIGVGGNGKVGIYIKELLEHPKIVKLIGQNGITWRPLAQVKTIEDAVAAARQSEAPVRFTFKWRDKQGNKAAHAVVALKDMKGNVRIIDYTEGKTAAPGKLGYASWAEMVAARAAAWGDDLKNAKLSTNPADLPGEFTSTYLKVLHFADGNFAFALPVAIGMKWTRSGSEKSFAEAAPDIGKSLSEYFDKKLGDKAPPPPESLYPPPTRPPEMVSLMYTHTVEGPRIEERDWLSNIAKKWYGDVLLWPILFDFNKGPDFTNQNKMYVGQRVKVPFITDKTRAEIEAYRKRGLNWK